MVHDWGRHRDFNDPALSTQLTARDLIIGEERRVEPIAMDGAQDFDETWEVRRLFNIRVCPCRVYLLNVFLAARGGEHNDRHGLEVRRGPDSLQDLPARQARQVEVKQNQIRASPAGSRGIGALAKT